MSSFPNGPTAWGNATALNISTATVVKATPGVAVTVQVITAGSAAGAVYDSASTSGNSAANQVATIPNVVGYVRVAMPCGTGIVVAPGTSQVLAVSYV